MTDDAEEAPHGEQSVRQSQGRRSLGHRVQGLAFVMLLRRVARRQLDEERPSITPSNPRSAQLRELAERLAADGREDARAIEALKDAADRRRKDLMEAAASVRSRGWVNEEIRIYRANQLLLAAASGQAVPPLTPEQATWFQQIEATFGGPVDEAFARLVALQPEVARVQRAIQLASNDPDLGRRSAAGRSARIALRKRIKSALEPIVGPHANAAEPLVRTHRAYEVAEQHLRPYVDLPFS